MFNKLRPEVEKLLKFQLDL